MNKWISLSSRLATTIAISTIAFFPCQHVQGAWEPAEIVSDGVSPPNPFGGGAVLSVNQQQRALAVWAVEDYEYVFPDGPTLEGSAVFSSTFLGPGLGWTPPVLISSLYWSSFLDDDGLTYINQTAPHVALNSSNRGVAVWQADLDFGDFQYQPVIYAQVYNVTSWLPYTDWPTNFQISDTTALNSELKYPANPVVAVNETTALVAWRQNEFISGNNQGFTAVAFYTFGGTWSSPEIISLNASPYEFPNNDYPPDVALNEAGDAIVVWRREYSGGTTGIEAAVFSSGSGWSGPITLQGASTVGNLPKVALNDQGNGVVIWTSDTGSTVQVLAARWNLGSGFSPAVVIAENAVEDSAFVGIDAEGNAIAIWESNGRIRSSRSSLNGSWSRPVVISRGSGNTLIDQLVQKPLAVDDEGNAIAIWRNSSNQLVTASRFPCVGWIRPEIAFENEETFDLTATSIGLGTCGLAVALWEAEGESDFVMGAFNPNIFTPSRIKGKICSEKFAAQERAVNVISWKGADSGCILFYRIRRDGEEVGIVFTGGPLRFVDPQGCRKGRHTYTVSSVNVLGFESTEVSIVIPRTSKQ